MIDGGSAEAAPLTGACLRYPTLRRRVQLDPCVAVRNPAAGSSGGPASAPHGCAVAVSASAELSRGLPGDWTVGVSLSGDGGRRVGLMSGERRAA
jgi:hypothetical protein